MNDEQLTALAAKAFELRPGADWWMPLDNDGPALRLAARLRIDLQWDRPSGYVQAYVNDDLKFPLIRELFVGRVDEAVRRVIVRAAAHLGADL